MAKFTEQELAILASATMASKEAQNALMLELVENHEITEGLSRFILSHIHSSAKEVFKTFFKERLDTAKEEPMEGAPTLAPARFPQEGYGMVTGWVRKTGRCHRK